MSIVTSIRYVSSEQVACKKHVQSVSELGCRATLRW